MLLYRCGDFVREPLRAYFDSLQLLRELAAKLIAHIDDSFADSFLGSFQHAFRLQAVLSRTSVPSSSRRRIAILSSTSGGM